MSTLHPAPSLCMYRVPISHIWASFYYRLYTPSSISPQIWGSQIHRMVPVFSMGVDAQDRFPKAQGVETQNVIPQCLGPFREINGPYTLRCLGENWVPTVHIAATGKNRCTSDSTTYFGGGLGLSKPTMEPPMPTDNPRCRRYNSKSSTMQYVCTTS